MMRKIPYFVEFVALVVLLLGAGGALRFGWQRTAPEFQEDYEESNVLNAAVRTSQGLSPYPDPRQEPIVFNPYGPVVYYGLGPIVTHFGVYFRPARIAVWCAALSCALLIAAIVGLVTRSWIPSLLFCAAYLCVAVVTAWIPVLRVDFFGVMFTLLGVLLFLWKKDRPWIAALPWVVAIFVKYTFLSAPAAGFFILLWRKQWRDACKLAGVSAAFTLAWFLYLHVSTDGWFTFNMFRAHPDPSTLKHLAWFMGTLLPLTHVASFYGIGSLVSAFTILLLALTVVGAIKVKTTEARFVLLYAAICLAVTTVTGAKLGSNHNHLLELMAAACLCAGVGYSSLRKGKGWVVAFVALAALAFVAKTPRVWRNDVLRYYQPGVERGCPDFYTLIKNQPGRRILSSNVGAVLVAGKPVLLSNPYVYSQLVEHRGWPDTVADKVAHRDFDVIALDSDIPGLRSNQRFGWSEAFVEAVENNYTVTHRFDCMQAGAVFERKP